MGINISKFLKSATTPPKEVRALVDVKADDIFNVITNVTSPATLGKEFIINALLDVAVKTADAVLPKEKTSSPFKSRKWIAYVAVVAIVALNAKLGHFMNSEDLILISTITALYTGVEGAADFAGRLRTVKAKSEEAE